ncbi:hypothetical protein HOLleu_21513 [Holothuria leucospilota]|uniref:Uncharacterized protein n=1 Tax=Holothuria leucospilota TaxID=206669 RepID=A0A9Q1H6V5_HOLLE|nr:hypothetical protein HOLleu_21513 [Holothuria leucospilota]
MILTCIGDKLELFDMKEDRAIKTCEVKLINHGWVTCMSVRENHVFIGFHQSHKITVYDLIDFNETQSFILHGMQICNHPCDMTVTTDRIYACINEGKKKGYQKTIIFGDKNGRMETLSELKEPIDGVRWYAWAITVNITLGVIAVAWSQNLDGTRKEKDAIAFYSLSSENVSSFLIIDVDVGVDRIRISDKGDRMVTGNYETGGVKFYDTVSLHTTILTARGRCFVYLNIYSLCLPTKSKKIAEFRCP